MDVWNIETFDGNLLAELKANETLVRKYIVTDREIFLEREAAAMKAAYRTNPMPKRTTASLRISAATWKPGRSVLGTTRA